MSGPRRFLFLQGPHGPFFDRLARALRGAGHETFRVALNAGDAAFWNWKPGLIRLQSGPETWADAIGSRVVDHGITDLVLYGDARPAHAAALRHAKEAGLQCHVFEEGYLRPHWITYERGPSNGNSSTATLSIADMGRVLDEPVARPRAVSAHWGAMRRHIFWSVAYHARLLGGARGWPEYRSHRDVPVLEEAGLAFRRMISRPLTAVPRRVRLARFLRSGAPYHVVLLQLGHDLARVRHGRFRHQPDLVSHVLDGFARGAPKHHHLVFKLHPLDDGRDRLRTFIRADAVAQDVASRVHVLDNAQLAPLLDAARSAVTDTSTSAMQALWRGLPVLAFGRHVFTRPELTSSQSVAGFFAHPEPPDLTAEAILRAYLLATSQIPGSFYTSAGRVLLARRLPDLMLDPLSPEERLGSATGWPQLRAIREH